MLLCLTIHSIDKCSKVLEPGQFSVLEASSMWLKQWKTRCGVVCDLVLMMPRNCKQFLFCLRHIRATTETKPSLYMEPRYISQNIFYQAAKKSH